MSIFSSIKEAIWGKAKASTPATAAAAPAAAKPAAAAPAPAAPVDTTPAMSDVDVMALLTEIASHHDADLNWKTSIVDLMKLVGLDPSLANRKELAEELGYAGEKDGSAEMNIWLHKQVMTKLAEHGGTVPVELTH